MLSVAGEGDDGVWSSSRLGGGGHRYVFGGGGSN